MKRYFLLLMLLGFSSCDKESKEESIPLRSSEIVGSWQLSETYISPGGQTSWQAVENGDIYYFVMDGAFSQINVLEVNPFRSGTFSYANELLVLSFTFAGEEKSQTYLVEMADSTMTLTPAGPAICIEPCLYRFKKIIYLED